MGKKGQVTIFVIIALVIVVLGVLIYLFRPDIVTTSTEEEENPQKYVYDCMIEEIEENIEIISRQGGNFVPQHPYMYQGDSIDYVCYTPNYFEFCQVEKPLLVSHVEREIRNSIQDKFDSCLDSLVSNYRENGYAVNLQREDLEVLLIPDEIKVLTDTSLRLELEDVNNYDNFDISMRSNLYGMVSMAYNILNWESRFGDADVNTYMDINNDFLIDKIKRTDGTKIYVIKETSTGDIFQFASRSMVRPAGYGVGAFE